MNIQRLSAFSLGNKGGNPAGVVLLATPANETDMARIAAEVGYSETAFANLQDADTKTWRVRYFSPESEVPFCGHATIALGAALAKHSGSGTYKLNLNNTSITVDADQTEGIVNATLSSPPTKSEPLSDALIFETLALFGLAYKDLDERLPPAFIHAGANHFVLPLKERSKLKKMTYDIGCGREMMNKHELITIMLVYIENNQTFVARNAFASGGVFEDPATGSASAAFAGFLRDQKWPHGGKITIRQGEDMGCPSQITVRLNNMIGASVHVSGSVRKI